MYLRGAAPAFSRLSYNTALGMGVAHSIATARGAEIVQLQEMRMNWDRIEGNWKQAKGRIKEQWGKLTDDDLDVIDGKREQLAGKIQHAYGVSKDEAEQQLARFESRYRN